MLMKLTRDARLAGFCQFKGGGAARSGCRLPRGVANQTPDYVTAVTLTLTATGPS